MCVSSTVGLRPKLGNGENMTHGEDLLVIGEAPHETSNDVSNPEYCVDQHRLVVLPTHPVALAGDGGEDAGVVVRPAVVAGLEGTSLHQADYITPKEHLVRVT